MCVYIYIHIYVCVCVCKYVDVRGEEDAGEYIQIL